MSWDNDDDLFPPLQTREGPATGHANERTMLGIVGGQKTIRTQLRDNPDGSQTRLKTRGGFADFVTTGSDEQIAPKKEYIGTFAGVPVSYSYPSGYKNGKVFAPMDASMAEEEPGSMYVLYEAKGPKRYYNEMYSTKPGTNLNREHPGNRSWKWKSKGRIVSWWSPSPMTGTSVPSGFSYTPQLLGGTKQAKKNLGTTYIATFSAWITNRTSIFLDGVKVFSVPESSRWIYAAAATEIDTGSGKQTVILILTSAAWPNSRYEIPDGPLRLMSYNVDTAEFNGDIATTENSSAADTRFIANFAFNEAATKVAYTVTRYSPEGLANSEHIMEMDTATGSETVVRRVTLPTPEYRFWANPIGIIGSTNAWDKIGPGSNSGEMTLDIVRGFFYQVNTLKYAKLINTTTVAWNGGALVGLANGYDTTPDGGWRSEGTLYMAVGQGGPTGATVTGSGGVLDGFSYQMTSTTNITLDGNTFGDYTLTHNAQASGSSGGEEHKPLYQGIASQSYAFDSSFSGFGSYTATGEGTRADFAIVTAEGDAVVLESTGGFEYTETITGNRPAFGEKTSITNRTGVNFTQTPTNAFLRYANGVQVSLPGGGNSYASSTAGSLGAGDLVYKGGITSSFDGTTRVASIVALAYSSGEWQPTWAHLSSTDGSVAVEWPGQHAHLEAPIFFAKDKALK